MQGGKARKAALAASFSIFASGAMAATFVYVSNAEDGDIGVYTLARDGSLQPGERFKAEKPVMPMTVSGDKRYLVAAVRAKPFSAYTYAIDRGTGALKLVGTGPLAESLPYIHLERSGRYLLGASYSANLVSVNPVGPDGRVGEPLQVIPTARNAHAIRTDNTINTLGVDGATGKLTYVASTPTEKQPRGFRIDPTGRSMIVTGEKSDTISSYAIDPASGALRLVGKYPTGKGSNWVEIVAFD